MSRLLISKRSRLSLNLLLLPRKSCSIHGLFQVKLMISPKAATPAAPAAVPSNRDDLYEMAIQYKKEEDFSGWYTDVSPLSRSRRPKLIFRSSSKVRCLITMISQDVTFSDQGLSTSGKLSRVRPTFVYGADDRMVRRRDQEARCPGMLFPNVHFSW